VERPVPPPRATTRKPRERELEFEARFFIFGSEANQTTSFYRKEFNTEIAEAAEKGKTGRAKACRRYKNR
jgi:hypothetical protein